MLLFVHNGLGEHHEDMKRKAGILVVLFALEPDSKLSVHGPACLFSSVSDGCCHYLESCDWTHVLLSSRTGRPDFNVNGREEAEEFFVSSLASWQEKIVQKKVILMGHSLGGYLAATYALKHPEHVEHLILVCPAAIVSIANGL